MSEMLILIGGDAPEAPLAWARVEGGRLIARGMSDATPPPATAPQRTVLLLPGADARVMRVDLPARTDAQARAGAEMMLGATLAVGEPLHYATGARQDGEGDKRLVAIIAAARLRRWLERCASLGADPAFVTLDCVAWPVEAGDLAIAATPNRVIVAGGAYGGFSIEPALAPMLTAHWLANADFAPRVVVVQGGECGIYRDALQREVAHAPLPEPVETLARAGAALTRLAPNLRQGEFAVAGAESQPLALWRFAALLLVAAVLLQTGSLAIAGWRDGQAARQVMAQAERDFRAARPDVGRIVNLRAQAASLVNAMEQSVRHPVLATSEPITQALRQHPLARLDEVRHDGQSKGVRLILSAPQPAPLEAAITALREHGLTVQARTIQPREGRYAASLSVEAP